MLGVSYIMLQSLDRALKVLEYLSTRKSAGISKIAEHFGVNKSTATRIMQTFAAHDIVEKDEFTQTYHISNGTLQFTYQVILNNRIMQVARPSLMKLSEMTKETAKLCAIGHDCIYVLDQVGDKKGPLAQTADIPGMRKPFHCSAVGKIMMAHMPHDEARYLLERLERKRYTENTICDIDLLTKHLHEVRVQGYALNLAEYSDRAYCVAVPVFDESGAASYAIGFSGMTNYRRHPERFQQILGCMKTSAQMLTNSYRSELTKNFV